MHITNVHRPPKKVYICKTAAIVPITLYFTTQKQNFTHFNARKNRTKETLRSFFLRFSFSVFKMHIFQPFFEACDSLRFSFFVRIVFVEVLCKKAFFHL